MSREDLSRRDFIKIAGIGLGAIATSKEMFKDFNQEQPADGDSDKFHKYEGKTAEIVERVWIKYGISILSQKEYMGELNLPWPEDAIEHMANSLPYLPEEYFRMPTTPKRIFLMRKPGTKDGFPNYTGGLYAGGNIALFIPEGFDKNGKLDGEYGKVYFSPKNQMTAAVCHEITHGFIDSNPGTLRKYEKDIGWQKDKDGSYKNLHPENLITESEANKLPSEDIAAAADRMLVNPNCLSKDRIDFFTSTPPFCQMGKTQKAHLVLFAMTVPI